MIRPTSSTFLYLTIGLTIGGCGTIPSETFTYPPSQACPTEDHGGWYRTNDFPAERIEWLVSPEAHRVTCASPQPCASIGWEFLKDGVFYGRVWSPMPPYLYSPAIVQHELCHTQGWAHGRHVQRLGSLR